MNLKDIIDRIEADLNQCDGINPADPPVYIAHTGQRTYPIDTSHADYLVVREFGWDGQRARLLPDDIDRLIRKLRITAEFDWSPAADARAVLEASGLLPPPGGRMDDGDTRRALARLGITQ